MLSPSGIIRECLQQLEESSVHPLRRLALEVCLNRLLPELQRNGSDRQITAEYTLLRGKVCMFLKDQENLMKLKDLEEHLQVMLTVHGRTGALEAAASGDDDAVRLCRQSETSSVLKKVDHSKHRFQ